MHPSALHLHMSFSRTTKALRTLAKSLARLHYFQFISFLKWICYVRHCTKKGFGHVHGVAFAAWNQYKPNECTLSSHSAWLLFLSLAAGPKLLRRKGLDVNGVVCQVEFCLFICFGHVTFASIYVTSSCFFELWQIWKWVSYRSDILSFHLYSSSFGVTFSSPPRPLLFSKIKEKKKECSLLVLLAYAKSLILGSHLYILWGI